MKNNVIGKPLTQVIRESQSQLDLIKKNISEMCDQYDVRTACLSGSSNNIYKDNQTRGYFEIMESYDTLNEAISEMKLGHKLLIRENKYHLGVVKRTLNECNGEVINLYSDRLVKSKEAINACDLDDIHTPQQLMSLYEKVSELKDVLESLNIEIPEVNPDLDARQWIVETWNKIHESLEDKNLVISDLAYTSFRI